MRRRGGRNDPCDRQPGQDKRYDGGNDGSPAVTPVSANPVMPSTMDAHDSSKEIPWARPSARLGPRGTFAAPCGSYCPH